MLWVSAADGQDAMQTLVGEANHGGGADLRGVFLAEQSPTAHREAETAKAHRG